MSDPGTSILLGRPSESLLSVIQAAVRGPHPPTGSAPAPAAPPETPVRRSTAPPTAAAPSPAPASPAPSAQLPARSDLGPTTPAHSPALDAPPTPARAAAKPAADEFWAEAVARTNARARAGNPFPKASEPAANAGRARFASEIRREEAKMYGPGAVAATDDPARRAGMSAGERMMLESAERINALVRAGKL